MKKGFFKTILTKGGTLFAIGVLWTLCILVKAFYCERSTNHSLNLSALPKHAKHLLKLSIPKLQFGH